MQILRNLIANWKTTSAGILLIVGSIIHLIFAVKAHTANEGVWTASITAIVGGIGLLVAGDAAQSQPVDKTNIEIK